MVLVSGLRIYFFDLLRTDMQTHTYTHRPSGPMLVALTGLAYVHGERYWQPGGGGEGGGASLLVYSTHTPGALHADWHVTYVLTRTIWCSQTVPAMYERVCVFVCLFKLWQFSLRSIISYTDTDTDEWKMNEKQHRLNYM